MILTVIEPTSRSEATAPSYLRPKIKSPRLGSFVLEPFSWKELAAAGPAAQASSAQLSALRAELAPGTRRQGWAGWWDNQSSLWSVFRSSIPETRLELAVRFQEVSASRSGNSIVGSLRALLSADAEPRKLRDKVQQLPSGTGHGKAVVQPFAVLTLHLFVV